MSKSTLKQELLSEVDEIIGDMKTLPLSDRIDIAQRFNRTKPIIMTRQSFATPRGGSLKPTAPFVTPSVESEVAILNSQPGRNPVEKAVVLLASRDASFKALDFSEQCRRGGEYVRTLMGGAGTERKVTTVGAEGIAGPPASAAKTAKGKEDSRLADVIAKINKCTGRNTLEKIVDFASKSLTGFSATPLDQQVAQASAILADIKAGTWPSAFDGLNSAPEKTPAPTTVASMVGLLNSQQGRNPTEKAITLLASRDGSFRSLPWVEQCRRGGEFSNTLLAGKLPVL